MKRIKQLFLLTIITLLQLSSNAQGIIFFTAPGSETINKNAIMPAETGIYIAMQKSTTSSSLYWLKNSALTEIKSIGNQYASIFNSDGTYGKQWFTNGDNALFVSQNGFPYPRSSAVWITNGTAAGTDTLFTFAYGSNVNIAGMIGNDLYFSVTSLTPYQTLLYKTNFTKAGTLLVKAIGNTNLTWNYIDNGVLYLNGYVKIASSNYAVLYSYKTDTTRLILGANYFPARVINGDLYAYADGRFLTKKNLSTNVVTEFYFPDTKEGDRVSHIDEIMGVFKNKLYLKCNLSLSSNNIANYRIYTGDISETAKTINFTELRSTLDKAIIIPIRPYLFNFGENLAYFIATDGYGGNISLFTTDSMNKNTHVIQELMTGTNWAFTYEARSWICGDRLYFYGADYKTGSSLNAGRTFSTCDTTSGSLSVVNLNAGADVIIQDMVNFQGKLLYSKDNFTSNKLYAITACSAYDNTVNGIVEHLSNQFYFDIFPNPCKGNITIKLSDNIENSKVSVCTVLGELVYCKKVNELITVINLDLKAGFYFVSLDNKGVKSTQKLVVE